jgi:hypothetical protein
VARDTNFPESRLYVPLHQAMLACLEPNIWMAPKYSENLLLGRAAVHPPVAGKRLIPVLPDFLPRPRHRFGHGTQGFGRRQTGR